MVERCHKCQTKIELTSKHKKGMIADGKELLFCSKYCKAQYIRDKAKNYTARIEG